MLLLGSILGGLALLVLCSASLAALGVSGWVVYAGVVVAVHTSLRRPFADAAVIMLVVAWAADLLASGPPGMHGLMLTLAFFAVFALGQRIGGRFLLATFALSCGASLAMALGEALVVGLLTGDVAAVSLFGRTGLTSSVVTGMVALPYSMVMTGLERLYQRRTERSVVVD